MLSPKKNHPQDKRLDQQLRIHSTGAMRVAGVLIQEHSEWHAVGSRLDRRGVEPRQV